MERRELFSSLFSSFKKDEKQIRCIDSNIEFFKYKAKEPNNYLEFKNLKVRQIDQTAKKIFTEEEENEATYHDDIIQKSKPSKWWI